MTNHHPGGGGLIGKTDIKSHDSAGKHGPQAKTAIHFPVGKKLGQAILIGNPAAFNKTDKLQPVALQKPKPGNLADRIPFQRVAVFSGCVYDGLIVEPVYGVAPHTVKTAQCCPFVKRRSVRNLDVTVRIRVFFPAWAVAGPKVEGHNPLFGPIRLAQGEIFAGFEFDKGPGVGRLKPAEIVGDTKVLGTAVGRIGGKSVLS